MRNPSTTRLVKGHDTSILTVQRKHINDVTDCVKSSLTGKLEQDSKARIGCLRKQGASVIEKLLLEAKSGIVNSLPKGPGICPATLYDWSGAPRPNGGHSTCLFSFLGCFFFSAMWCCVRKQQLVRQWESQSWV